MTARTEIHGILAYPVTPFTDDDRIDTDKLAALVDRLVAAEHTESSRSAAQVNRRISPKPSSMPSSTRRSGWWTVGCRSSSVPRI